MTHAGCQSPTNDGLHVLIPVSMARKARDQSIQCHLEANHHYTKDNGEENGEETGKSN